MPGGSRSRPRQVRDYERAGLDVVWVAEAYGFDAPSFMGYLAATTDTIQIGSAILPIYSRTPTLIAQTAAGIDAMSDGRCILGLGASGPQVIEGWHGVPYQAPLGRTREIIDICHIVWKRERLVYDGRYYTLPLPPEQGTGLGKPLKIIPHLVRDSIPIYVASLGPKNVQMTAEVADGWLPLFFVPERAASVWGDDLRGRRGQALGRPRAARGGGRGHRGHRRGRGRGGRARPPDGGPLRGRHGRQGHELLQRPGLPLRLRGRGQGDPGPLPRRQEGRGGGQGARRAAGPDQPLRSRGLGQGAHRRVQGGRRDHADGHPGRTPTPSRSSRSSRPGPSSARTRSMPTRWSAASASATICWTRSPAGTSAWMAPAP